MTSCATPPRFAEAILTIILAPRDREPVSGDLLEEYRESVYPVRGPFFSDLWYVRQVIGFLWRIQAMLSLILAAAILTRNALDWLAPVNDLTGRATASTLAAITILTVGGLRAGWRSRSWLAGTIAGITIPLAIAPVAIAGALLLVGFNHDPETIAAIRASGGLSEALTLPPMLCIPGAILGTLGGLVASGARAIRERV